MADPSHGQSRGSVSTVGWQPSRFLTDRAEAERTFQLAEQLGSVNAAAQELAPLGRRSAKRPPAMASPCPPATRRILLTPGTGGSQC
jgi:hypothetical protein